MIVLQWTLWMLGLGLQGLLLLALSHGAGRHFPALFAYVVCLVVTTATDILATLLLGPTTTPFVTYYWSAELIRQSALFALVASLAFHALPSGHKAQAFQRLFTIATVGIWIGSVVANHDTTLNKWMTTVVRNLSFFTGMLNLFTWFAYARSMERDTTRLMIVAGLGMQMTGEAIGQAIRLLQLWDQSNLIGGLVVVLSHLLCLYIWWRAFRTDEPVSNSRKPDRGLSKLESHHSPFG